MASETTAPAARAPPPARPTPGWSHQDPLPDGARRALTEPLDEFVSSRVWPNSCDMLVTYVASLPPERNLSQLVVAEMAYMFFHGPECPLLYAVETDVWFVFRGRWRTSSASLTLVKAMFQQDFLPTMQRVLELARASDFAEGNVTFLDKTVAGLGNRLGVEALIKESAMFFDRDPKFDEKPFIFQLSNCVLDLRSNKFRPSFPSDMARRCSPISIPLEWLANPERIASESARACDGAWSVMWSMFSRDGPFHADDHFEELGDQDEENFRMMMRVHARLLEGMPLGKCVILTSTRGRNSKGLCEKVGSSQRL